LKIIMDSREPELTMLPILVKAGFETVEVTMLDAGDYFIPDCNMLWSWKSVSDFCQSIYTNHLKDEIARMILMGNQYWQGLIIWCADHDFVAGQGLSKEVENLIEVYNAMYIPTFVVRTRLEGAELMRRWALKAVIKDFPLQIKRNVIAEKNEDPVTVRILSTIDGVGPITAAEIAKKYSTIDELIRAIHHMTMAWWYDDINGVGKVTAEKIEKALLEGK